MRYFFLLPALLIIFTSPEAVSGELVACGVPESYDLPTETENYCNFHQRRFAYREEAMKLKEQLKERQENFAAPRRQAREQYEENWEALNQQRSSTAAE